MGLDMYLERMPRYRGITAKNVMAIDGYFSWIDAKTEGSPYANCTPEQWCGLSITNVSEEAIEFYKQFRATRYPHWDTECKYGHNQIYESVGYWRKANAIHKWFVDNVQDGEDNCDYYEVTKEQLEELLDICNTIKAKTIMKHDYVENGQTLKNGEWQPTLEEGKVIANPEVAASLLPTQSGFFFGGTGYDQWYMQDIDSTIEILTAVLKETDFDKQMIAYCSSW